MNKPELPAHWRVLENLQKMRSRCRSNSFESDVNECAMDLVLYTSQPTYVFSLDKALGSARSIVTRRKRRERARGMVPLLDEGGLELAPEVQKRKLDDVAPTLEDQVVWLDTYRKLAARVSDRNRTAGVCLQHWRAGRTVDETAVEAGISRDYVKKLRKMIRTTARDSMPELSAA